MTERNGIVSCVNYTMSFSKKFYKHVTLAIKHQSGEIGFSVL